jgi:predicted nucleic acid-binding protein
MICIDTCILIWAIREHVQPGREDMIPRSKALIKDYADRSIQIMIPSIVLAEYLAEFDEQDQVVHRKIIADNFFIVPFDNAAAWEAGLLYDKARVKAVKANGTPKQCVHADLKIIATAIAAKATHIFTDNVKDFTSLANGKILVGEVPLEPTQLSGQSRGLFDGSEAECP